MGGLQKQARFTVLKRQDSRAPPLSSAGLTPIPLIAAYVDVGVSGDQQWTRREPPGKVGLLRTPRTKEALMSARAVFGLLRQQPTKQRVAALKRIIPLSLVQRALSQTRRDRRHCPVLPLWLVVWLVIGMGLFARDSFRVIFKRLQPFVPGGTPQSNTICQARLALGLLPLRL